jgi:hypothetical protein
MISFDKAALVFVSFRFLPKACAEAAVIICFELFVLSLTDFQILVMIMMDYYRFKTAWRL